MANASTSQIKLNLIWSFHILPESGILQWCQEDLKTLQQLVRWCVLRICHKSKTGRLQAEEPGDMMWHHTSSKIYHIGRQIIGLNHMNLPSLSLWAYWLDLKYQFNCNGLKAASNPTSSNDFMDLSFHLHILRERLKADLRLSFLNASRKYRLRFRIATWKLINSHPTNQRTRKYQFSSAHLAHFFLYLSLFLHVLPFPLKVASSLAQCYPLASHTPGGNTRISSRLSLLQLKSPSLRVSSVPTCNLSNTSRQTRTKNDWQHEGLEMMLNMQHFQ